jgi:hypothetical protein
MLYNIFNLFFNKESHYGELVCEFRFTVYRCHLSVQWPANNTVAGATLPIQCISTLITMNLTLTGTQSSETLFQPDRTHNAC